MNVRIRLAEKQDVSMMLAIYAPFVTSSSTSFEITVPTPNQFWERVQKVLAVAPWLVCTLDDVVVGYAYAGQHRSRAAYQWSRELSVYVHPDYRKKGIATGLYTALIEVLKIQGFTNALIGITLPNEASVRFHENMGFQPVGVYHRVGIKLGQFYDVGWWELALLSALPKRLKSLEETVDTKEWEQAVADGIHQMSF